MTDRPHYAKLAEAHWREHCPRLVQELEASGALAAALQEAHDQTVAEMADLIRKFLSEGLTPDQAERQAWELVRQNHILLPPEE